MSPTSSILGSNGYSGCSRPLIEIFLEPAENLADLFGTSEVGYGIGNRIVVLQAQQRCEFRLVEFFDTDTNVIKAIETGQCITDFENTLITITPAMMSPIPARAALSSFC